MTLDTQTGVEVYLHSVLNSALDRVSGQLHVLAALTPEESVPVPNEWEAG